MSDFFIENGILKRYTGNAERITIPDGVKTIGACAFSNCSSLISVHIPDSVTAIRNYAFAKCSSLTAVHTPNSVTKIGRCAFWNCSSLTSVHIPDSVTTIGEMIFCSCFFLTSVHISNSITTIRKYAFANCSSLTSVHIPDSVTTIRNMAFYNCSNLKEVSLPENIKIEKDVFPKTTKITYRKKADLVKKDIIKSKTDSKETLSDKNFIIKNRILVAYLGSEEHVKIPEGVMEISSCAFARCEFLLSVEIPDSVTKIHDYAFTLCSSLEQFSIPQSVKIGENILYGCDSLMTLTIQFMGGASGIFDKSALETMFQKL